jgi:hypothetical protein
MTDPYYNPDFDLYLGIDKGFRSPNVTLWIHPDRKMERVIVLFAHYQVLRTPDENAKIVLAIHQSRGYGQLTGGWGDPSAPDMLRAYSLAFGVDISGPRQSVAWGHEIVKQWLKTAKMTKGAAGLVFSRWCPRDLLVEVSEYEKHEPWQGGAPWARCASIFFCRVVRSMTLTEMCQRERGVEDLDV